MYEGETVTITSEKEEVLQIKKNAKNNTRKEKFNKIQKQSELQIIKQDRW